MTIPFNRIQAVGNKVGIKDGNTDSRKKLNLRRQKMLSEMGDNPNITIAELALFFSISETAIENNLAFLRENGYIERIGSKKAGYWKVID